MSWTSCSCLAPFHRRGERHGRAGSRIRGSGNARHAATSSCRARFFEIYIGEAEQHVAALHKEMQRIEADPLHPVGPDFMRAAHTLASTSRTTGFEMMADVSHALEKWLTGSNGGPSRIRRAPALDHAPRRRCAYVHGAVDPRPCRAAAARGNHRGAGKPAPGASRCAAARHALKTPGEGTPHQGLTAMLPSTWPTRPPLEAGAGARRGQSAPAAAQPAPAVELRSRAQQPRSRARRPRCGVRVIAVSTRRWRARCRVPTSLPGTPEAPAEPALPVRSRQGPAQDQGRRRPRPAADLPGRGEGTAPARKRRCEGLEGRAPRTTRRCGRAAEATCTRSRAARA